jgi:hypothetical protein
MCFCVLQIKWNWRYLTRIQGYSTQHRFFQFGNQRRTHVPGPACRGNGNSGVQLSLILLVSLRVLCLVCAKFTIEIRGITYHVWNRESRSRLTKFCNQVDTVVCFFCRFKSCKSVWVSVSVWRPACTLLRPDQDPTDQRSLHVNIRSAQSPDHPLPGLQARQEENLLGRQPDDFILEPTHVVSLEFLNLEFCSSHGRNFQFGFLE